MACKNIFVSILVGPISQSKFHQQFKEPPEGAFTGLNKTEVLEPVKDLSNDMEQLQHRFVKCYLTLMILSV